MKQVLDFRSLEQRHVKLSAGSLEDVLLNARTEMAPVLAEHIELALNSFNLIVIITQALQNMQDEKSRSVRVTTHLLARLANDLLGICNLAKGGFAMQAVSLTAVAYETAVTIAAIGSDDDLAKQWIDHEETQRTILSVKQLSDQAEANLGLKLDLYEFYSGLCMYKHINPVVQRPSGFIPCPKHEHCNAVAFFPTAGCYEQERCRQSLELACLMTWVALSSFTLKHFKLEVRNEFVQALNDLGEKRAQLTRETLERFA